MVCSTAYAIGICIVAVIAGIAVYYTVNKAPPDSDWVRNGIDAGISSIHRKSIWNTEQGFDGFADKIVMDTLKEYANESGNIKIKGNIVRLNKKGLIEYQKPEHEWD
jgi:hypothetical protein